MSRDPINIPLERERIKVEARVKALERVGQRYLSNEERDELYKLRAWLRKRPAR